MNLCPFARRELDSGRVRFHCSRAETAEGLMLDLQDELLLLAREPDIETTVLVHPGVLAVFSDYLDFLELADALLEQGGWQGEFQIASFHPDYQFEGAGPDDVENYSNRSPYPMLHLLREASLELAIDSHPDTAEIPRRNIELLRSKGLEEVKALRRGAFSAMKRD